MAAMENLELWRQEVAKSSPRDDQDGHYKTPVVVGIYGVSGSGKSFLLKKLKEELRNEDFAFYEGSAAIAAVCPDGLEGFLRAQDKTNWRQEAIKKVQRECSASGKTAIVAGHFMFWSEEEVAGHSVCTPEDLETYTHILYLDVPPTTIAQYRSNDKKRSRSAISVAHLEKWQQVERDQLRQLCPSHGILFMRLSEHSEVHNIATLLRDFRSHTPAHNLNLAERKLDQIMKENSNAVDTVLLMDADKTLAAQDSGELFWKQFFSSRGMKDSCCPLKDLFSSPLKYSYTAFRQAMLLCEEAVNYQEFDRLCEDVASRIKMYPEFVTLLRFLSDKTQARPIVVTCGLRLVWLNVLESQGLSDRVRVIGGGRLADRFVVTPKVKSALVSRLHKKYKVHVWAFGDSPLDLDMLRKANEAVVVTGWELIRSKSMDEELKKAIGTDGFRPRQALLPSHVSPRLDTVQLPLLDITTEDFFNVLLRHQSQTAQSELSLHHATDRAAAKLLMAPTRDSTVYGPGLREAHRRVGYYLAMEFVADIIGVEEYAIPHVQGHQTEGHRLLHENETMIVALMRGGEPMAFGVNDAFPLAQFVHAQCPENITRDHLRQCVTILLVDSVVNNGTTILDFVRHIRGMNATVRIIVVAGVIQANAVSSNGVLTRNLSRYPSISLVTLRLSNNKFTGTGTTDTGNRLFNTTHLI